MPRAVLFDWGLPQPVNDIMSSVIYYIHLDGWMRCKLIFSFRCHGNRSSSLFDFLGERGGSVMVCGWARGGAVEVGGAAAPLGLNRPGQAAFLPAPPVS